MATEPAKEREYSFVRKIHGREETYTLKESALTAEHFASLLAQFHERFKELPTICQDMFLDCMVKLAEIEAKKIQIMMDAEKRASDTGSRVGRIVGMNGSPLTQ